MTHVPKDDVIIHISRYVQSITEISQLKGQYICEEGTKTQVSNETRCERKQKEETNCLVKKAPRQI